MIVNETAAVTGLRERKKTECRRALADAARQLANERGVDGFTIGDVASLANVSTRTFFNYFETKEDAVIGTDPSRNAEMVVRLLERPADESPLEALRCTFVHSNDDLETNAARLATRVELVHRYPELLPRHLVASHQIERSLIEAMATRLGMDDSSEPFATIVVTVAMAAVRSTMLWWYQNGRPDSLVHHINDAFAAVDRGFSAPTGRRSA